jgi:hypothetical protein
MKLEIIITKYLEGGQISCTHTISSCHCNKVQNNKLRKGKRRSYLQMTLLSKAKGIYKNLRRNK